MHTVRFPLLINDCLLSLHAQEEKEELPRAQGIPRRGLKDRSTLTKYCVVFVLYLMQPTGSHGRDREDSRVWLAEEDFEPGLSPISIKGAYEIDRLLIALFHFVQIPHTYVRM